MKKLIIFCLILFSLFTIEAKELSVLTVNLWAGNQKPEEAAKKILSYDADIILLLEWTGHNFNTSLADGFIPKLARIDYIFVSKYFKILKHKNFHIPGSDHRAVFAVIEI